MARKTFLNGYPLPASDLNTYLMDQTVQTYADATARTAALATPTEGQMSYLADTNTAYVYDGSSWNAVVDAKNYGATLPNGAAGRNKVINGDFEINQRQFTSRTDSTHGHDRWFFNTSGATGTYSTQAFTPGTAPVSGYESTNFARLAVTTGNDYAALRQNIEDVRTFAGQTVTLSFWAKGTNPTTEGGLYAYSSQTFGSGGSATVTTTTSKFVLTANWTRYSLTFSVPSIAGKTIGAGSHISVAIGQALSASTESWTLDLWGVQLEAGSVATPFATATGTKQGELAACQRYYWRSISGSDGVTLGALGAASSTTNVVMTFTPPVSMRSAVNGIDYSLAGWTDYVTSGLASALTIVSSQPNAIKVNFTTTGVTQYRPYLAQQYGAGSGYVGFGAELL